MKSRTKYYELERSYLRFKAWRLWNGDYDHVQSIREFSGRMTKARWKKLDKFCRIHSRSPRYTCGHDYDCCGCECGRRMEFTYHQNQVTLILTINYNY